MAASVERTTFMNEVVITHDLGRKEYKFVQELRKQLPSAFSTYPIFSEKLMLVFRKILRSYY